MALCQHRHNISRLCVRDGRPYDDTVVGQYNTDHNPAIKETPIQVLNIEPRASAGSEGASNVGADC